jgi:phosphoribosylformimino-5-aminoimidazole carboxamide ribotide isomerase
MLIIPAIDLQNGEAVRLVKGDYAQKTVYSHDPVGLAQKFENMGCQYLHVVDLDGAKEGAAVNRETIAKIRAAVTIPIQIGGGIRSAVTVDYYLREIGIDRVILGTAAIQNPVFLNEMVKKYGAERIVAGVDVRDGKVAASGWLETTDADYLTFIDELKKIGAAYILVTDISRDGTLTSPNWELVDSIKDMRVIVAGGVSCEADIMRARGYYAIIVGKAYYEGRVDLEQCLKNV